jgi:hypothetical protein
VDECSKLVALITATDLDSGKNGELTYLEIGGNASSFLTVDKDTALVSLLISRQSLPQNGTYHYIVQISDKGEQPGNTTVTILFNMMVYEDTSFEIIDIFPKESLRYNFTENALIPSPFIYLMNFTTDSSLSGITFHTPNYILGDFYLNGTNNEYLFVNTTTLQRKQNHPESKFDREKQQQYRFIIQAKVQHPTTYSRLAEVSLIFPVFALYLPLQK